MTDNEERGTRPEGWPSCEPGQMEVMLLGTYHMANPGLDTVNVDADDVLAAARQQQLRDLVSRFEAWNPDRVAIERPYDEFEAVNDRYRGYRSGDDAYDTGSRSEVAQIGFRLADRLGHERVFPIDEFPDEPEDDPFADREIDSTRQTTVGLPDPDAMQREQDERLTSSTLLEYFAWMNTEDELRNNHDLMFDTGIRTADGMFDSPALLAYWYDRNLRMVHHLWRVIEPGDERLFLLVGSGHVRVLRHLLDEAPMFCPVSPLLYLQP